MRPHWGNCLTHSDAEVASFIAAYFSRQDRRCLLVAGAGFDPRATLVARQLERVLGDRLEAVLIREERDDAPASLRSAADANEAALRSAVPRSEVVRVRVFADDNAPVGGARVTQALRALALPDGTTDLVVDLSAISIGIGFPATRLLLEKCEAARDVNFHLMIASNPELDARILGEPADRAMSVRGFSGRLPPDDKPVARLWLPHLASGSKAFLAKIQASTDFVYKTCPILPFPARNPRRADDLIAEFSSQLRDEWRVGARDLIYASERNPLDTFRTISTLKERYERTVEGVYVPQLVLSPLGSKVMAAGAMMAAIEHGLTVQYVETVRYEYDDGALTSAQAPDTIVHVWLHGPVYAGYVPTPGRF